MNFLLSLFAKAASSPIVTKLLVPALAQSLTGLIDRLSKKLDVNGAKAALAHAETAEELREASKKIKAAMDRSLLSCTTPPRPTSVESCTTDPKNDALQCTKVDNSTYTKPFSESYRMICYPATILDYLETCK